MEKLILKIFDPKKEMILTTDASKHGVSVILLQEDHPIMYLYKKLTKTEVNYSNIEKEVSANVWSTDRARQFY